MNRALHFRPQFPRFRTVAALVAALVLGGTSTLPAAKVLFIVNSFTDPVSPANANDQEVLDRLTGQGHKVTLADDDTVKAADITGMDLILISSSVGL